MIADPKESVGRNRLHALRPDGRTIELEDGSLWKIVDPDDLSRVEQWLETDVYLTRDRFGEADYILVSGEHGGDAVAVGFTGSTDDDGNRRE
jgi:hypothetical protein